MFNPKGSASTLTQITSDCTVESLLFIYRAEFLVFSLSSYYIATRPERLSFELDQCQMNN